MIKIRYKQLETKLLQLVISKWHSPFLFLDNVTKYVSHLGTENSFSSVQLSILFYCYGILYFVDVALIWPYDMTWSIWLNGICSTISKIGTKLKLGDCYCLNKPSSMSYMSTSTPNTEFHINGTREYKIPQHQKLGDWNNFWGLEQVWNLMMWYYLWLLGMLDYHQRE